MLVATDTVTSLEREVLRPEAALDAAFRDYAGKLRTYAFSKTHSYAAGEDLVQDTFIKAWNYLARGGKIEVMRAFLYHVLNNLIVDEYRRHKTVSLDVLLENGREPAVDLTKHFFDTLDGRAAQQLIRRLPEPYRSAMRMRYVQDLSLTEMALITGKSKNTMAVHVHRGLEKLKRLYRPV